MKKLLTLLLLSSCTHQINEAKISPAIIAPCGYSIPTEVTARNYRILALQYRMCSAKHGAVVNYITQFD